MNPESVILFDLDGTLIDTVKDLNASVNYALSQFCYPPRSIKQTTADIGNGVAKLIARSVPLHEEDPHYEECLTIFKAHYRAHFQCASRPYPGIKEVLISLKEKGYHLAVVTNKFQEGADALISSFFPDIFEVVVGEQEGHRKKPDPDMVYFALSRLGVTDPSKVTYIGDTNVDYQTAHHAGTKLILVSYGYRKKEDLLPLSSSLTVVDTPEELLPLFGLTD